MKTFFWILRLALFLLALTFAVKNTDPVAVRYYLNMEWHAPLIFVILVVFCLGAVAGIVASLGHVMRLQREVSALRKQVRPSSAAVPAVVPRAASSNVPDVV